MKIKKPKKICFVVSEEVLKSSVTFYIGYTWSEFNEIFNKLKLESEPELEANHEMSHGLALTAKNKAKETCFIIWIKYFTWDINRLGVLAHEIIHTTGGILHEKQIPVRLENEEIFAYLHEFYFKGALKKLNPKT